MQNKINKANPKPIIRLHGCYFVLDKDLKIDTDTFGHDVFVVKISKNKKMVKVKTVTSIERNAEENGVRVFKKNKKNNNYVEKLFSGEIIVIPKKYLNTTRLSGIVTKGIWIQKNKLKKSKFNLKWPKPFEHIIGN